MYGIQKRNNGSVQIVKTMIRVVKRVFLICVTLVLISCHETNTPREFQNKTIVSKDIYQRDKEKLAAMLQENATSEKSLLPTSIFSIFLESYVDTIFYGPRGKMAFLGINKRINKNADLFPERYPDMIEYIGTGFMVIRRGNDEYELINDINFRATRSSSYKNASKLIRKIQFNEPMLDPHRVRYNINDIRFWDSGAWVYPDGSPVKLNKSD